MFYKQSKIFPIAIALFFSFCSKAWAHVKWFSEFSFADQPLSLTQALSPTFYIMLILSLVVIAVLVILDEKYLPLKSSGKTVAWLEQYRGYSSLIMRVASGAVLLLSFQSGAMFVPELIIQSEVIGWIQFFLAVLLMFPQTFFISGLGLIGLYFYGVNQFGWFHMLDYVLYAGVGYYLFVQAVKNQKMKATGLIALYVTVGFSLCWVSMEKLLYPQWSLYILQQNPQLALGLNPEFFLVAAAFIELALGYLMIICLLQRPLALVVTLVFFMTTLVFGKLEVIGHTMIHAALIVFLIEGTGKIFKTPLMMHKGLLLKISFAVVNFVILVFALLIPYQKIAMEKYISFTEEIEKPIHSVDVTGQENIPEIKIHVMEDPMAGWNVHLMTKNFQFNAENASLEHVMGEGHAHLYLNGEKMNRVYGNWYYLSGIKEGDHEIKVTLNTNDHRVYLNQGKVIEDIFQLSVESQPKGSMRHMDHQ